MCVYISILYFSLPKTMMCIYIYTQCIQMTTSLKSFYQQKVATIIVEQELLEEVMKGTLGMMP